ncbi:MAG: PEP/pyruvate-binding domain-containing protein [Polyangiales bacterium]
MTESAVRCIPLEGLVDESSLAVGGKARGLADLIRMGLDVPRGFVVVGATAESSLDGLREAYRTLGGGKVAVRSSAVGEDGVEASFAGQFETILGVEGEEALEGAVRRCLASLGSARASAYREARTDDAGRVMCVVVQRMVDAAAAGVLFTVDPVTGRRDRLVIDAVRGLGEALVSGHATPDHYELRPDGSVARRELVGEQPILSHAELVALASGARLAAAREGRPLDLEWAIDRDGGIHWLQARPVTHLLGDPRELDTVPGPGDIWTKCNIGEMMPGAVTPLTLSTTARGIDVGMQRAYAKIGSVKGVRNDEAVYVASFGNHLFLNLSLLAALGRYTFLSRPDDVALAVCGRLVPELEMGEPASFARRLLGTLHYVRSFTAIPAARERLETLAAGFAIPRPAKPLEAWRAIDSRFDALYTAYELHLVSSSGAGAMAPLLLGITAEGKEPTEAHHARVAELLSGATEVESADIAMGIDTIVEALLAAPDVARIFEGLDDAEALELLRSPRSGGAGRAFAAYLARHGHRSVREAEMRQREWRVDPLPVVKSVRASLRARARGHVSGARPRGVDPASLSHPMRRLVRLAHAGVRSRERSKSLLIRISAEFRDAYRTLGERMVENGMLPDADLVFFFTHAELGRQCSAPSDAAVAHAEARRRVLPVQMGFTFEEIFRGVPEPIEVPTHSGEAALELVGKPVSPGIARGLARVARTLDEASAVREGEILITPITDVGWTPCFAVIAGLATDIGSAVSHGAVVAREYGMPAVVNLRDATLRFRTGDRVILDGTRGTLRLDTDEG